MRITTYVSLLGAAALATVLTGCTVKDVDEPAFAGPSTLAHSFIMVAERDTLTQNGVDFTDIRITSLGPDGQSENIPFRAQVFVDGVPQDFGTLSTKFATTPATIRYTTPPASTVAASQVASTVTIAVTSANAGDFRGEFTRQLDINLLPQGVILPSNPNLVASFTFTPAAPQAFQTVSFDASSSTNNGAACALQCQYTWNFGDGTSGTGITTTHVFRTVSSFPVTLTVTDPRGAPASSTQVVNVTAPQPPTAQFTVSPTPAPAGVDVFFNASQSRATGPGRTIVSYAWSFGDGTTGSGVTTSHRYNGPGTYTITLTVTDDAGAVTQSTQTLTVSNAGNANATLTVTPNPTTVGQQTVFDASGSTPSTGASITNYRFNFGEGDPPMDTTNPIQSVRYNFRGTKIGSVEITDSNGKTSTRVVTVTVQ